MDLRSRLAQTLGDAYTLERELGGGGMARVFVAEDRTLGRRIVVKTLSPEVSEGLSGERFRREIRTAASLQQANIVPVHSTGEVDGVPYYTMPFVEGESLRVRLAGGALPVRDAVGILRDVARALAYAHDRGVVHRDIKPENILLSGDTAVVTDFGIAKAIEASQSQAGGPTLTHLGTVLGTPAYMSPEQAAGDGQIDHRADIYSLGVVAYELLSGTPPFVGRTTQALIAAHLSATPAPLAERAADVPPRLAALVMRCLEKDPGRRPATAAELIGALDAALTAAPGHSATAAKPSIAVLPFASLSPDPADEYFADGLTDEIITDLGGVRAVHVIARAAMMQFKGSNREPADVARELHVRYALEGSVRRAGPSLRLTARLIDALDGTTVWSEKLSGTLEDVFDMQERVSRTIVAALQVTLSPREESQLAERPIQDLDAYTAYLQAKQAMWSFAPESLERAERFVEAARARIGDNPRLLAMLGFIHIHAISGGAPDGARRYAAAGECAAALARVEPDSFSTNSLVGLLHWRRGEIREAIDTLSRAHALEPGNADVVAYLQYAVLLAGQDERARELARLLVALDPFTPLMQVMPSFCDLMAGRARDTLPVYAEYVARDSLNPLAHFWLLGIRAEAGDVAGMRETAAHLATRWAGSVFGEVARHALELLAHRELGPSAALPSGIRALSAEVESISRSLAWTYARLGAPDAALDALEHAIQRGLAHYPHLARDSQSLASLRSHPRFRRLLEVVRERWERGGTSAADLMDASASRFLSPRVPMPTVAVLPLANMSAGKDDEYFADGITEDVIAQLSQIASMRVISRTSAMGYKGSTKRPTEVASELGATHVIEGSVRRAGDRVRIVASLMDAKTESHLWSETFDRELTDIFAIQSEFAERIAAALVARITPAEAHRVGKRRTADMEAYNLFLLGRQEYNRVSPEAFARAEDYYAQAIARDPGFASAYAAKALVDMYHGGGYWGVRPMDAYDRALALARKALELDPDIGEAHMVLGAYESWIRFDWAASAMHFERAVSLNPSHAFTHIMHGWQLAAVGRLDAALEAAHRAMELDPASVLIHGNALSFYYLARRHDEFDSALATARRIAPFNGVDVIVQAFELIGRGRADEVLPDVRAIATGTDNIFLRALHAWCAAAAGAEDEARQELRVLHALERDTYVWATGFALAYAHLGEPERAFDYLERAYRDRAGWLNVLGCSPAFDIFRGDARFDVIVNRVGVVVPAEVARRTYAPMPERRPARSPAPGGARRERRSVAVLPFANLSPDPENEFFAEGITDDLIAQLAKIGALRVIARTSVARYRGTHTPAAQAARELDVDAVVEGTVRRAGRRARIVAQLIDVAGNAPIWSETFDRDLDDIFSVQTEVATNVAQALQATLTPSEQRRISRAPTSNRKAYDLYLLGRYHFNRRTAESLAAAIEHFEHAIARDQRFTAAHAGLADAYVFAGLGYAPIPVREAFEKAEGAAGHAIAIDGDSPEALCAAGLSALHGDWDLARARTLFDRAAAINPNHAEAHQMLGWCTFATGDYRDATVPLARAHELDPLNVSLIVEQGWPYSYAGLHDIALGYYQRAVAIDPGFGLGHYNIGMTYEGMGRYEDALTCHERAIAAMGPTAWTLASIATTNIALGNRVRAEEVLETLREQGRAGVAVWLSIAMVLDSLGRAEEAVDAIEHSIDEHEPFVWAIGLEGWLKFPNARRLPRFRKVYDRLGAHPHDVSGQRALLLEMYNRASVA